MAKIIKIGSQNLTPNKIANPFKTSRSSSTNPFKYNNFEGTTLPFELSADVFETKKANKLRMIASSVTGSMSKVKSIIPESIVNFAKRVHGNITSAWDYAKSTSFTDAMVDAGHAIKEIPAVKHTTNFMTAERHLPEFYGISSRISAIREDITGKIDSIVEAGRNVSTRCKDIVSNISFSSKAKYANMSVKELEECFAAALAEGGIA